VSLHRINPLSRTIRLVAGEDTRVGAMAQKRLFEKSSLSCEDVEDTLPPSVEVVEDLLQPPKHGLGFCCIAPFSANRSIRASCLETSRLISTRFFSS
jgi:hypothetical protein